MSSWTTSIDPYHVLCVEPGATPEEVKASYRRLIKQFHPDVNPSPDAPEKFRRIQDAWTRIQDGYKPERLKNVQGAYKIYEFVSPECSEVTIWRSETVLPENTIIHISKGNQMFKIRLEERKRLPFNITARRTLFKFRTGEG